MARNPVDTESATIASYWLGWGGFVVGLIGIGFSIYTTYNEAPALLLVAGSGWLAALLVGATAWLMMIRLLRYLKGREEELRKVSDGWMSLKAEHERLLSISDYLVSKTVRKATKRAVPAPENSEGGNQGDG
jgi:uncharacterized membrane protein